MSSVRLALGLRRSFPFRHDLPAHSPKNNPVSTTRRITQWEQTLNDAWETGVPEIMQEKKPGLV